MKSPNESQRPLDRHERLERTDDPDAESTVHLIERARIGDHEAIERLMARHLAPLQHWARGRLPAWARGMTDTDDLVQDVMLRTLTRLGDFEPRRGGALQSYLREAISNRIRDELRRNRRRGATLNVDEVSLEGGRSPLEDAIGREALTLYEQALDRLPADDREAIIARLELGYSYEELAALLEKPTADAARKVAQRALVRLAAEMKRTAS